MVGHGGSSAGSYLADPTSPIPSRYASIVTTSTLKVKHYCAYTHGDALAVTHMLATYFAYVQYSLKCMLLLKKKKKRTKKSILLFPILLSFNRGSPVGWQSLVLNYKSGTNYSVELAGIDWNQLSGPRGERVLHQCLNTDSSQTNDMLLQNKGFADKQSTQNRHSGRESRQNR